MTPRAIRTNREAAGEPEGTIQLEQHVTARRPHGTPQGAVDPQREERAGRGPDEHLGREYLYLGEDRGEPDLLRPEVVGVERQGLLGETQCDDAEQERTKPGGEES